MMQGAQQCNDPGILVAMVKQSAGVSRDTAERLLARLRGTGLAREITGGRRFRLRAAAG